MGCKAGQSRTGSFLSAEAKRNLGHSGPEAVKIKPTGQSCTPSKVSQFLRLNIPGMVSNLMPPGSMWK